MILDFKYKKSLYPDDEAFYNCVLFNVDFDFAQSPSWICSVTKLA